MKLTGMDYHQINSFDPEVKVGREEAKALGITAFWTGARCRFGHLSHRYVSTGECCVCVKNNNKAQAIKRRSKKSEEDAAAAGICPSLRRRAEDIRDGLRLERQLSEYAE